MSSTCILRMEVKGKPRPRVILRGGKPHAYTPKSYEGYEESVARAYIEQNGIKYEGPVKVDIQITRKQPKSRPKRLESEPDVFKPDCDNYAKALLDALNGVAYDDDAQVTDLHVVKNPRIKAETDTIVITVEGGNYEQ